jgi:hypothetical protein
MSIFFQHSNETEAMQLADKLSFEHGVQLPVIRTFDTVIHWGASHSEVENKRVLQPVQAIMNARQADKRNSLLTLNGIKTVATHGAGVGKEAFPYKYKVAIFHLETLAVYEKKESFWNGEGTKVDSSRNAGAEGEQGTYTYQEVLPERATYRVRRAIREAHRAVYALGLDYGIVTLGVVPSGHTIVLAVDPTPKLSPKLADRFAEAMNRYATELAEELQRTEPVMLGSDPEFILLNPLGKVVSASRFLERKGPVGCDAIVLSGHRVILPLAELRPQPSYSPRELIRNLHQRMQLAARKINDESLAWLSGGMPLKGFPLGGHIHFSGLWLNSHLLRALDNYLALPLLLIEGETARGRRPRYGFLGDYRRQSHGGFEYRTLPSWLISPRLACGVVTLAALIASHYRELPGKQLQQPEVQALFYAGDKEKLRELVDELWRDLEGLGEVYTRYSAWLAPLRDMMLRGETWNETLDIRQAWKIAPYNRKEANDLQFML